MFRHKQLYGGVREPINEPLVMKYCQGPKCHTYTTKDRIRGSKGDKHYETRKRSSMYYGDGNFCDQRCQMIGSRNMVNEHSITSVEYTSLKEQTQVAHGIKT